MYILLVLCVIHEKHRRFKNEITFCFIHRYSNGSCAFKNKSECLYFLILFYITITELEGSKNVTHEAGSFCIEKTRLDKYLNLP